MTRLTRTLKRRSLLLRWAFFPLFLGAIGCGPGQGTVSGVVKLNGEPLPGGQVFFRPVDSRYPPAVATIDEHGNYKVTLPVGEALISVDNRGLLAEGNQGPVPTAAKSDRPFGGLPPGAAVGPPPEVLKKQLEGKDVPPPKQQEKVGTYVEIPKTYYNTDTSGLRYTVTSGSQTHDIELTK
jgi:hypothetical protein